MQLNKATVQATLLVTCLLLNALSVQATTTERVRFCGGMLAKALSMVCRSFNSPYWDKNGRNRVKRDYGIADECCITGCSWSDLSMYCADDITVNVLNSQTTAPSFGEEVTESPLSEELGHVIADRSVEAAGASEADAPPGFRALFGRSEMRERDASRSAPVVGTVSPLLVWGRTVHSDQPSRERLLYVTV